MRSLSFLLGRRFSYVLGHSLVWLSRLQTLIARADPRFARLPAIIVLHRRAYMIRLLLRFLRFQDRLPSSLGHLLFPRVSNHLTTPYLTIALMKTVHLPDQHCFPTTAYSDP